MNVDLRVDWCDYKAAKFAVEHWHYSKSVPAGKIVKFGAWEDGRFIGAVLYSLGANNNIGKPYGLKQTEICELTRVALTAHASPVSQIVSATLRMLKEQSPGVAAYCELCRSKSGAQWFNISGGELVLCGRNLRRAWDIVKWSCRSFSFRVLQIW